MRAYAIITVSKEGRKQMKAKKTAAILLSVLSIGALTIGVSACAEKDLAYRLSDD